jgi:Ca2+-transporting ATPase
LKAANIGVAMGKRELKLQSRRSYFNWWLIKMIIAVAAGRRIYSNLKKQYVISFPFIFPSPCRYPYFRLDLPWYFHTVHVIFLELVMGPMCSIVYENEPAEKNSMQNHQDQ